ncbi:ARIA [Symbiodinium natans]|uniref:ARIA protein n=1 Tax=Symbiodinium natans TaxID=878477 RepID=A0A812RPR6_9DINO|nr:ARIA [Symbiodinium natans]
MTQWGKVVAINSLTAAGTTPLEIEVDDLPPLPAERNLAEGIKILYQTCQLYDLNLVVGTTRLPAHKVVLASMSRACCEQVQKAVKEFQQQRQPASPSNTSSDTEKAEKAPPSGSDAEPEEKAVEVHQEAATTSSVEEVPATSPPIYSNQWKAPDSTAPVPAVPSETHSEPDSEKTAAETPKALEVPLSATRPELHLDIASPEAARALLDLVYGLGTEYNISSDAANEDVLRLATQLDVPCLQESATRYLGQNLTCQNAVSRLQTCKEFGLQEMYAAIEEEVVCSRDALQRIAAAEEVIKFPEILQGLLVRSAEVHVPIPNVKEGKEGKRKRAVEPKTGRPEKMSKAPSGRAVAGGGA